MRKHLLCARCGKTYGITRDLSTCTTCLEEINAWNEHKKGAKEPDYTKPCSLYYCDVLSVDNTKTMKDLSVSLGHCAQCDDRFKCWTESIESSRAKPIRSIIAGRILHSPQIDGK